MSAEQLQLHPPHSLNTNEKKFVASLTPREKELHTLATAMLGSSYFCEKTHGYTQWAKTNLNKQPPASK